jgi:hypothetical protein
MYTHTDEDFLYLNPIDKEETYEEAASFAGSILNNQIVRSLCSGAGRLQKSSCVLCWAGDKYRQDHRQIL